MSRSTSSPVRYSRCRRSALGSRLGGGTFPFTMVGALSAAAVFAFVFIDPAYHTFPFMGTNGLSHSRWLDLPGGRPFRAGRSHDLARDAGPERSVRSARYPGSTVLSRGKGH